MGDKIDVFMNILPFKVALLDDDTLFRKGLIQLLNQSGIRVELEASDSQELIEKLNKSKSLPDICILDVSLPHLNGFDTLLHLSQTWPQISAWPYPCTTTNTAL